MVTRDLHQLLVRWQTDARLLEPDRLRERFEILDELDAHFGAAHPQEVMTDPDHFPIDLRVESVRAKLEAANAAIYQLIRGEVRGSGASSSLLRCIQICRERAEAVADGVSYDHLDELLSGVFELHEPSHADVHPGCEMVFYQPTPVRHILRLMEACALSAADVLVDLGSGLGHVAMLASILTGAQSIGVETEAAYVASARHSAQSLGLSKVAFLQQDARDADLSNGTVFYLYTPFTGGLLRTVLRRLGQESLDRAIRIGTLGPCTLEVAKESWLEADTRPEPNQIICFRSRAEGSCRV
jgi:hypothetical protein